MSERYGNRSTPGLNLFWRFRQNKHHFAPVQAISPKPANTRAEFAKSAGVGEKKYDEGKLILEAAGRFHLAHAGALCGARDVAGARATVSALADCLAEGQA